MFNSVKWYVAYQGKCGLLVRTLALLATFFLISSTHALPPAQPLLIKSLWIGPNKALIATTDLGIYLSVNDGANWKPFTPPYMPWIVEGKGFGSAYTTKPVDSEKRTLELLRWLPPSPGPIATDHQGNRYTCIGDTIFKSIDGGLRWKAISTLPRAPEAMSPVLCRTVLWAGDAVYAGTLHGIFKSKSGLEWESAATDEIVRKAAVDLALADTSGNIYINVRTTNVEHGKASYKSTDGGRQWSNVNFGTRPTSANDTPAIVGIIGEVVYASSHAGLIVSKDGGGSWTSMSTGLNRQPEGDTTPWDVIISVKADSVGTLYATTPRQFYKRPVTSSAWIPLGRKGIPSFPK